MMTAKTKANALKKLASWKVNGFVYQFEKGHWDCCSEDSPNGQDLARYGMISLELNIRPAKFEKINK